MTESFNEYAATCHLDSLEVSLRNANDITYIKAQTPKLFSSHVTAGRDVTRCNITALLIYIPSKILI